MEESIAPPKKSFAQRYKFVLPVLLTVNLGVGAYLFMTTERKDKNEEASRISSSKPPPTAKDAHDPVLEKPLPAPANLPSVKVSKPISDDEKRQLFMWILEEKRKVKPLQICQRRNKLMKKKPFSNGSSEANPFPVSKVVDVLFLSEINDHDHLLLSMETYD